MFLNPGFRYGAADIVDLQFSDFDRKYKAVRYFRLMVAFPLTIFQQNLLLPFLHLKCSIVQIVRFVLILLIRWPV